MKTTSNTTRELYALRVSVWNSNDHLHDGNCNSLSNEYLLFTSKDDAQEYANNLDADIDIYYECSLYHGELDEETILNVTGYEDIDDFNDALNEPYSIYWQKNIGKLGVEERAKLAHYIEENCYGTMEDIDCANYDFDKKLDGAIVVVWAWHRYIGYARECKEVRYAYYDETESNLTKRDKTIVSQMDVVMNKEEIAQATDLKKELRKRLLGCREQWKWTNPDDVGFFIERQITK